MMRIGWAVRAGVMPDDRLRHEVARPTVDLGPEPAIPVDPVARQAPVVSIGGTTATPAPGADADHIVIWVDEAHGRAMRGFVVRMGLSADEGDDVVQETLLRLWSTLRTGVTVEDPKAWCFRTVYRLAMDAHRWRRRVEAIRLRLTHGPTSTTVHDPDPSARLSIWPAVDQLPPRQREILYLRYRADMTFEEAARVMGITAGAARANATKAMATLRRSVGSREAW